MTRAELIAALESLDGPSREMDAEIFDICGGEDRAALCCAETWPFAPGSVLDRKVPHYTSSIDSALTLGRNEAERRAILGAIYDNANETYTIARCILFGCAHALRLREESPQ